MAVLVKLPESAKAFEPALNVDMTPPTPIDMASKTQLASPKTIASPASSKDTSGS
ncbi:MAG: hypothetical protein ABIC68_06580 [Candidatus Omnitrophota bacterium]